MAQIGDLERRIVSAFDSIGQSVEALEVKWQTEQDTPAETVDPEAITALETALTEERTANAALEERLRALKSKHAEQAADLETQLADMRAAMLRLDSELQRLRSATDMLRDQSEGLRKANADAVGAPHLINMSLMAELETLRAERAADKAEIAGVMAALKPLLEQDADDTPETEEENA